MSDPDRPKPAVAQRRWRRLAIAVAAIATFGLLGVLTLPFWVRAERFRDPVERALADATGWDVKLGEVDFSVLRGFAVSARPVRLAAPGKGSSVEIGTLAVRARLLPLLGGRLEVRSIVLEAVRVHLLRPDAATGWSLPRVLASTPGTASSGGRAAASSFSIGEIFLRDGSLRIEDAANDPPFVLELAPIEATLDASTGAIDVRAEVPGGRGRLHATGAPGRAIDVQLEEVASDLFNPWLAGLIEGDGRIGGTLRIAGPAIEGKLDARGVRLLAAEAPVESLVAEFSLRREGDAWQAERLSLGVGGTQVRGSGKVSPDLDLNVELAETPLEDALRFARAFLPVPLELTPPGSASARIEVEQIGEGALVTRGNGSISAARLAVGGGVPDLESLRADFELTPAGDLILNIQEGQVAGGPIRGVARVHDLRGVPRLTFDGSVERARLGGLLGGFLPEAARAIEGPSSLALHVALDLASIESGPRALGGGLRLNATDVALPGWDMEAALQREIDERLGAVSALLGRDPPKEAERSTGRLLETLSVEFSFAEFPWSVLRVDLGARGVRAQGDGSFDPVAGRIDLALRAVADAALTARLLERRPELRLLLRDDRIELPLQIQGSLTAPTFTFDSRGLVTPEKKKEAARDLLRRLLR